MNEFYGLVLQLGNELERDGMKLYRYCTNSKRRGFVERISYAAHPIGEPRPRCASRCARVLAILGQREGATKRCTAYRELSKCLRQEAHTE